MVLLAFAYRRLMRSLKLILDLTEAQEGSKSAAIKVMRQDAFLYMVSIKLPQALISAIVFYETFYYGYHLNKKGGDMNWGLFGQIVLLIVIFAGVITFVKCMHDSFCFKCKRAKISKHVKPGNGEEKEEELV